MRNKTEKVIALFIVVAAVVLAIGIDARRYDDFMKLCLIRYDLLDCNIKYKAGR